METTEPEPVVREGAPDRLILGLSLAVFVAVCIAELTRQLGTSSWNTVWAEDGSVYLTGAWNSHFLHGLGTPYAGYLGVVPRLLAQIVVLFPVADAAAMTALLAAAVAAASAVFVFLSSAEIIRSVALRLVVSLAPAVLAVSGLELLASICNLHWYLIFASFWAFLWRKTTTARLLASAAVVAAATLSDPLTGLYAPLAIALCAYRRRVGDIVMVGVLAGCSAIQLVFAGNSVTSTTAHAGDLGPIFGYHVTASLLVGDRFVPGLWGRFGYLFIIGTVVVLAAGLGWAARRCGRAARLWMGVALLYSLTFFVVSMMLRGTAPVWPPVSPGADSRYFFLPVVFIVAALCIGVDGVSTAGRTEGRWRWPCVILVTWAGLVVVLNYGTLNGRSAGPSWRDQVRLARDTCSSTSSATVELPISPGMPWAVKVPCRDLR